MRERLGRYEIREHLAQGGMGELYVARGDGDEHDVVLKCVSARAEDDPRHSRTRMFLDEARVTTLIRHDNVVRVYEVNYEDGVYYLVMEKLEGWDLAAVGDRLQQLGELLPVPIVARLMIRACRGLHAAHECTTERGEPLHLVHRDISPGNLFLTQSGALKVLDFGIAKTSIQVAKTRIGYVKGKFSYMSPEQARGHELDRRSDLFSLGIVMHELLTGERLFSRETPHDTVNAILHDVIMPPARPGGAISPQTAAVAMRALSRDPAMRFASAADMADALAQAVPAAERVEATKVATLLGQLFDGSRGSAVAPTVAASESNSLREWAHTVTARLRPREAGVEETDTIAELANATTAELGPATAAENGTPMAEEPTVAESEDTVAEPPRVPIAEGHEDTVADRPAPTALERLPTVGSTTVSQVVRIARQWPAGVMTAGVLVGVLLFWLAWPSAEPETAPPPAPAPTPPPVETVTNVTPARVAPAPAARKGTTAARTKTSRPRRPTAKPEPRGRGERPRAETPRAKAKSKRVRATGQLTLDSKPWANVYLGDRMLGPTPLIEQVLPAGRTTLHLKNPKLGLEKVISVVIPANDLVRTTVQLDESR